MPELNAVPEAPEFHAGMTADLAAAPAPFGPNRGYALYINGLDVTHFFFPSIGLPAIPLPGGGCPPGGQLERSGYMLGTSNSSQAKVDTTISFLLNLQSAWTAYVAAGTGPGGPIGTNCEGNFIWGFCGFPTVQPGFGPSLWIPQYPAAVAYATTYDNLPGPVGATGPIGDTGPPGVAGVAGVQGIAGPFGPAGPPGVAGIAGIRGPFGPVGPPGSIGPFGPIGLPGLPGSTGARGAPGAIGLQGPIGPIGGQGIPGLPGGLGLPGPVGPRGDPGSSGGEGPTGPAGPAGPEGVAGPEGLTGPIGPIGLPGTDGPVFGPDTTPSTWGQMLIELARLVIANAIPGPPGPIGEPGQPGETGETGEPGEPAPGEPGPLEPGGDSLNFPQFPEQEASLNDPPFTGRRRPLFLTGPISGAFPGFPPIVVPQPPAIPDFLRGIFALLRARAAAKARAEAIEQAATARARAVDRIRGAIRDAIERLRRAPVPVSPVTREVDVPFHQGIFEAVGGFFGSDGFVGDLADLIGDVAGGVGPILAALGIGGAAAPVARPGVISADAAAQLAATLAAAQQGGTMAPIQTTQVGLGSALATLAGGAAAGLGFGAGEAAISGITGGDGGICPTLFRTGTGPRAARPARVVIMPNPSTGAPTFFGHLGAPMLYRGDLAACKRVERVAKLADKALHRRRPR